MPGVCETAGMLTHELFKRSSKAFFCGRTEPPTERYRKIAPVRLHQTLLKDSQSSSKVSFQVAWFLYSCAVLCVSDFVPLGVVQKRDSWVFIGETSPLLSNLRVGSLVDAQATLRQDPFQGVLKVEVIADTLQAKMCEQEMYPGLGVYDELEDL